MHTTDPMRHLAALALALLALAPACQTDDPGEPVDDRPRGERCDDMQACGRENCAAEMQAVLDCNTDPSVPGCGFEPTMWMPLQEAFAECLIDNGCNSTTCDLVGAFTREDGDIQDFCEAEGDGELLNLARAAMFNGDVVAECRALE